MRKFLPRPALMLPILLGALLALPADSQTRSSARRAAPTESGFTLAFVDADVKRVVDAVLGEMMGVDYSVDPAVQGNVTLRTRQPVPRSQLLPLLENALRAVNAVILSDGSGYRVISRESARTRASVSAAGPSSGESPVGFASEVVRIERGSAAEIAKLLEQFIGKEAVGGVDPSRNQVMIVGTADERRAARALIERFDVDALANMTYQLYRLENVDAETLAAELDRIFQPPFDIIGTRVRVVPLPRLRSLLLIAADRADIGNVEPWIRRLDAGVSGKRKLYSYSVQNGRARDLATSLQLVLGMRPSDSGESRRPSLPSGPPAAVFDEGSPEPSDVIASQTPLPGASAPLVAPTSAEGPRIVPNEENNSLLIYANGEEYEFIREALDKLDQPVAQVLIEATLAEVTPGKDLQYGIDFRAISGDATFANNGGGSAVPRSIFPGFSVSLIGSTAQAVLNTLQSKTNVRVLSAPKLMVLNNQTATLQVGDQVPIVVQQAQSVASPGAPIVNSVELRDTGVILKVTPRVNDSGTIILDIIQEVSDVARTTTSGINSPTIQQRRIASTVATRSGQMIALGGLIREGSVKSRSGIPVLSQIPVIGGAFGTHQTSGNRTELIILLTPTVMRTPQQVDEVVGDLLRGLDRVQPLLERARETEVNRARRK